MTELNENLSLNIKDKFLLFTSVMTCFVVFFSLFTVFLSFEVKREQHSRSQHLLVISETMTQEFVSTINALNALNFSQCDKSTLKLMRKALFKANYIKDIGFFQDGILICTTGVGVLEAIVVEGTPDYTGSDGFGIWPNHQVIIFDEPLYAFLAIKNNFNAVIEKSDFEVSYLAPYEYELTSKQGEQYYHLIGTKNLSQNQLYQSYNINYHQNCSKTTPYCVTLYLQLHELITIYKYWLGVICLVSLLLTSTIKSKLKSRLLNQHSVSYRIEKGFSKFGFYWIYQPIVALKTGKIIGCEVLARFKDKDGNIYPDQFIPIIRKKGITWPFTKRMVERVVKEFESNDKIPDGFRISFNLFPSDLIDGRTDELKSIANIQTSRFRILLEITEDEYLDESQAQAQLFQLKKDGFLLAVDDFGTGYANLMQLKKAPFEYIKIDRSYVNEIEKTNIRLSLVPNVIDIARSLKMEVVAEGVENELQSKLLCKLGVQYGQGWEFGRPESIEKLVNLLKFNNA